MGLTKDEKLWIQNTNKELNDTLETNLEKKFADRFAAFQQNILELKMENATIKQENSTMRQRLIENDIRIDDLEQYGRRMNIRIEGLTWAEGETTEQLQKSIIEEVGKQGVTLKAADIIRLHRSSRPKEKNGVVTKQAIVRLATWKARERFHGFNKAARQTEERTNKKHCRINNDLTKRRLQLLTEARSQISGQLANRFSEAELKKGLKDSDNVFAYSNINCELRMRVRGKVVSFNNLPELRACLDEAFPVIAAMA